jgi:hypothetical protein
MRSTSWCTQSSSGPASASAANTSGKKQLRLAESTTVNDGITILVHQADGIHP